MNNQNLKNSRVAIWGCGANLERKREFVSREICPCVCVDINSKLWDREIFPGVKCVNPSRMSDYDIDSVVISIENRTAALEIRRKLKGIPVAFLNDIWDEYEINRQKTIKFPPVDERVRHFSGGLGDSPCNISCDYCYLSYRNSAQTANVEFPHSIQYIVKALSPGRIGGFGFFDLCSNGETLLKKGYTELAYGLLDEGHYLCTITNGTVTSKLKELLAFSTEKRDRMWFHFSFHYLELLRNNLLDTFFENFNMVKSSGASISMSLIGSDEYLNYKEDIKKISLDKTGILPYISAVRSAEDYEYDPAAPFDVGSRFAWDDYVQKWEGFPGKSLELRSKTLGKIEVPCWAGVSSGVIDFESGEFRSCIPGISLCNIYDDITSPIQFLDKPHSCEWGFCSHNAFFLSGRTIKGQRLPSFYEVYTNDKELIGEKIRRAADYCCEY